MTKENSLNDLLRVAERGTSSVLILGATGTGKSRLAREIHDRGPRRGKPFVVVNLATLHEGTLESELFGHERGAFTGADSRRVGRLEIAHGGTVFLDEIGELSPRLQARLLEFLQSKRISPVGSNRELALDVRVIAATHRNLETAVRKGEFREDLFHRLRVVSIRLTPLSERREEFDSILHACLADLCAQHGRSVLRISEGVAEQLERYDWPGNIRELRNVLEYAVLSADSGTIELRDLPHWFVERHSVDEALVADSLDSLATACLQLGYYRARDEFNKRYFTTALEKSRWRVTRAARQIGMSKTTFLRRLNELGIHPGKTASDTQRHQ